MPNSKGLSMDVISQYVIDEEDIAYEYELQKTPQSIVTWRRYLNSWNEKKRPLKHVIWLYERFCAQFRNQEDIWVEYFRWLTSKPEFNYMSVFQRFANVVQDYPHGCESLCTMLIEYAVHQYNLDMIRQALDLSLNKMPIESHSKAWDPILRFVEEQLLPLTTDSERIKESEYEEMGLLIYEKLFGKEKKFETADIWSSRILQKYIKIASHWNLEDALKKLVLTRDYKAIKEIYGEHINQGKRLEPNDEVPYSMHLDYLTALEELQEDDAYESFLENMRSVFPHKEVELVLILAKHYIKHLNFAQMTETLERAMQNARDVRSFTVLYEFNVLCEKLYLETVFDELKAISGVDPEKFDLRGHLDRLKNLVETHSLRVKELLLKKNCNSVEIWRQKINLYSTMEDKCSVYAEAILTIDPMKVTVPGSFGILWCEYAKLYWDTGNRNMARELWDRALRVPFPYLEDLENIWTSWTEHELDCNGLEKGIQILEVALKPPESPELTLDNFRKANKKCAAQSVVFTSLRLWSLYLDLQEAMSLSHSEHIDKTISVYEQMIALKVATPLHFINYAHFLQMHGHKRLDSFRIYERAIAIFPSETRYEIWNIYLAEATDPNACLSKESIRDLFDHALETLVPNGIDCKPIFVLYSDFEEKNGLVKRSVDILLRGCRGCKILALWTLCISKARDLLGGEAARPYYEECLKNVPNSQVTPFVLQFVESEAQMGELERAREILKYGAQLQPPVNNRVLWEFWEEFELQNGDKESYKSMLKLRRKLESEVIVNTQAESQKEGNVQFVAAASETRPLNPEEIDLNI
ncbi:SYF1 (YDR416W) [Zygosaccharomyces parabailii]|nr:SYF1 (YDR416W) [Zygosaccharomyces parabailii]CDH11963.1 related to Pre-mRNA-splicing factor SYF1 [Zygosaccharomyces bailii ISA1307]